MQAFPRECTASFLEGHKRAFEFFDGVPIRSSYAHRDCASGLNVFDHIAVDTSAADSESLSFSDHTAS